jgi:hypothetical protein
MSLFPLELGKQFNGFGSRRSSPFLSWQQPEVLERNAKDVYLRKTFMTYLNKRAASTAFQGDSGDMKPKATGQD